MPTRNLEAYATWFVRQRRRSGGLSGMSADRSALKATLFVGRKVDALRQLVGCSTSKGEIGEALSRRERKTGRIAQRTILGVAREEVGGATAVQAEGLFERSPEPSSAVTMIAPTGASPARFRKDVRRLAQSMARKLAQKEIMVSFTAYGREIINDASPEGLPAPEGNRRALDAAIRKLKAKCQR